MGKHKHHIVPKHMGGTDDSSNLIELSVEEHAEAHRELYEKYGSVYDFVAWKALSGQITSDEARRLATVATWTGRNHTEETKEKIRAARERQPMFPRSEETKKKISDSLKGHPVSENTRKLISEGTKGKPKGTKGKPKRKIDCPHCGKVGAIAMMYRWHFDKCKLKVNRES